MNIGFDRPLLAAASLVIVPLAVFLVSRLKNPFLALIPLGAPGGVPFKAPFRMDGFVKFLKFLEAAGVFLLFISAAGPVIKHSEIVWLNRGADVLFVIDISPSMAALDMDGQNRFDAARTLILEFAEKRPSDSIGLVAVGNDAALLVPPTTDREALRTRLGELRIAELGDGTALGMGLAVASYHLDKSEAVRRVTVLITDGENNAGSIHPETAASILHEMGISLWVIGLGSGGEVPIDYVDPFTRMRRTGIFDSRFDAESLRRLSLAGGGVYIAAPSADAFAAAFARLDEEEMVVRRSGIMPVRRSLLMPVLITAFALLCSVRFIRRMLLRAWL